jgi:hypothetical protein
MGHEPAEKNLGHQVLRDDKEVLVCGGAFCDLNHCDLDCELGAPTSVRITHGFHRLDHVRDRRQGEAL